MNAFEKIKERLEEESQYSCSHCMDRALSIVSEAEEEYINKSTEHINKSSDCSTNGDKIRSMSDEELADFLEEFEACDVCKHYDKNRCTFENPCVHEFAGVMIWEWLKSPTTD